MRYFLFIVIILSSIPKAQADDIKIIDGDGLILNGQEIRLWGIDAPELYQECTKDGNPYPCGMIAKTILKQLMNDETPVCTHKYYDRNNRSISQCKIGNQDLASMMVNAGYAFDWPHFSKEYYQFEQSLAKEAKRGLWGGKFEWPWIWKRNQI